MSQLKRQNLSSLENVPFSHGDKTWGSLAVFGNTSSAAVATWCFVSGGFIALFLGAAQGGMATIAGTLIGVFISLLAALPIASRYGLEGVRSTRPVFGVRGTVITFLAMMIILVGWNSVLTIVLADAMIKALSELKILGDDASSQIWPALFATLGVLAVFLLLQKGTQTLRWVGPTIAITVLLLALWMGLTLIFKFGWAELMAIEPLDPFEANTINYSYVLELCVAGGLSWWPYAGGLTRNATSKQAAIVPSILGFGFMMALVLVVGMLSGLAIPESEGDPTVFLITLGGPSYGVFALAFLILANIGTVMVGAYAAALGLKQFSVIDSNVSWRWTVALVLIPVLIIATVFRDVFMSYYGTFVTAAGILLGPICGILIADYFFLRRQELDARALYSNDKSGSYWYLGGFNLAGIIALIIGISTYLLLQNPFTYEPRFGQIILGSGPGIILAGVVYTLLMKFFVRHPRA